MNSDRSHPAKLKDLPEEDRPQERLERLGSAALSDRELLAMVIRSGTAKKDVLALADELLKKRAHSPVYYDGIQLTFSKYPVLVK